LLLAYAKLAFTVIPVLVRTALFALMMELKIPLKRLPALPLSLPRASAQSVATELMPVLGALLALLAKLPLQLVKLLLLNAISVLPTTSEMLLPRVPAARSALPTLNRPLVLLPKLRAIAKLAFTEMPNPPYHAAQDALLALIRAP
jgi:hypothetical protein